MIVTFLGEQPPWDTVLYLIFLVMVLVANATTVRSFMVRSKFNLKSLKRKQQSFATSRVVLQICGIFFNSS